jgi:cytochrome P450
MRGSAEEAALAAEMAPVEEPTFYDQAAREVFARLRREDPVHWYAPLDLWLITKYDDTRRLGADPGTFSSEQGLSLNDLRLGGVLRSFFGELISTTDPPGHRELRRVIASSFVAPRVKELAEIRRLARRLVSAIRPGQPVEFVSEVTAVFPLQVIALVLGLPPEDAPRLRFWSDEMVKSADVRTAEGLDRARANAGPLHDYFNEWIARNIGQQGQQLIRRLFRAQHDGDDVATYETVHMFLGIVLVAGNETTRNFLAGSVNAYAEHPGQLALVAAGPVPRAVEECLRWVTPVRSKVRTVVKPASLRARQLTPGQRVLLLFMSGNRDEEIWESPEVFDVARERASCHLAFGFGEHGCLGSALARLEGRVLFEELSRAFRGWQVVAPPVRHSSEVHNSFDELVVSFTT